MGLFFRWLHFLLRREWWEHLSHRRPFFWGVLSLLFVLGLHTVLFYAFERGHHDGKLDLFTSFWLTLTTFTTVGYGDISAVTVGGRWTTIVLGYVMGLSLFAWLASTLVSQLFERTDLRRRGMVPLKLNNHTLLVNMPSEQKVRLLLERMREAEGNKLGDVVVVANTIESLPFHLKHVHFVRGSITDPDTYKRAAIDQARRAIVLANDNEDPASDALTAAAVAVIESLNPSVHTIAECVFESHLALFRHVQCNQIVYTGDILVKLLVQEAEDEGAARAIGRLLEPRGNELYSVAVGTPSVGQTFQTLFQALLDHDIPYLPVGFRRDKEVELNPPRNNILELGDELIFLGTERPPWQRIETQLFGNAKNPAKNTTSTTSDETPSSSGDNGGSSSSKHARKKKKDRR